MLGASVRRVVYIAIIFMNGVRLEIGGSCLGGGMRHVLPFGLFCSARGKGRLLPAWHGIRRGLVLNGVMFKSCRRPGR
ncbi:hypothetical protein OF83DRAFT_1122763 [Amylostereum chailletii]|nr:hypothetical protein OF83DRAFT_1122763 [Amylostereum chailletii]